MISEQLLGEAIGIIGDGQRSKHSNINAVLLGNMTSINNSNTTSSPSISPALSPSPSSSTVTTPTSSSAVSGSENLRCPRCDSTNTKFCYYNNYNLTQPRHFCKTCRRYWTKGGALRNVPIGGGCRKNKSSTVITSSSASLKSTAAGKFRAMAAEIGKSGFMSNFDGGHDSPILWTPPPPDQNSHLLSLLKANQNPDLGPMSSFEAVKEEGSPAAQVISSLWRDNNNERQHIGLAAHDLYQRLRSSATNYSLPSGNINVGSSSSSSTILDSAPVAAADQLGCWNPILSWSDLPATHGAYPSIN